MFRFIKFAIDSPNSYKFSPYLVLNPQMIKLLIFMASLAVMQCGYSHHSSRRDHKFGHKSSSWSAARWHKDRKVKTYKLFNVKNRSSSRSGHKMRKYRKAYSKSISDKAFLYYFDKKNNVKYYYPNTAIKAYKLDGKELKLLRAIGGVECIVRWVYAMIDELFEDNLVRLKYASQKASLAKQLVDFFVVLINGDGYDYSEIRFAFKNIRFLDECDFDRFIIASVHAAQRIGINSAYISVIKERLTYCHTHFYRK